MIQVNAFTITWDMILAIAILVWAGISKGPARIWKNDIHTVEDCWTKGWEFEAQVMFRYILILASGVWLSFCLYPGGKQEMLESQYPPLWVVIVILIALPAMFIVSRRSAMSKVRKRFGGRQRPMSLGYTLADGKGKIKLSRLKKEE